MENPTTAHIYAQDEQHMYMQFHLASFMPRHILHIKLVIDVASQLRRLFGSKKNWLIYIEFINHISPEHRHSDIASATQPIRDQNRPAARGAKCIMT